MLLTVAVCLLPFAFDVGLPEICHCLNHFVLCLDFVPKVIIVGIALRNPCKRRLCYSQPAIMRGHILTYQHFLADKTSQLPAPIHRVPFSQDKLQFVA